MRRLVTLLCFVAAFALVACDKKPSSTRTETVAAAADVGVSDAGRAEAQPKIVYAEGPKPTDETVIASAGDHKVTIADFDRATQISLLFAPSGVTEMPPERMALPHVHVTMTQALLSQQVIDAEAERRGIEVSDAEIKQWLLDNDMLNRFGKLFDKSELLSEAIEPYGLTADDLRHVARTEILNEKLAEALLEDVPRDEVWRAYALEKTTRTLALVSTKNMPSADGIDDWMGDHAAEIDAYFQKNQRRFRVPKRVKLNIVRPKPGQKVDESTLKAAAADLEKGIQPVTVARTHGMQEKLEQQLVEGENKRAFRMKPGDVGWTSDGPRGAYAWKVVGFENSRLPEMSRSLRREISAEMLRTTQLTPEVEAKLEQAAQILENAKLKAGDEAAMDALEQEIEAIDGLQFEVTTFPEHPGGSIPNHGLAEEVLEAAFETKVGAVSEPIFSRERGFVFRVLSASKASRKVFERSYDEQRKAYLDALQPRAVQMWSRAKLNELGASVEVDPLRVKYGVLRK